MRHLAFLLLLLAVSARDPVFAQVSRTESKLASSSQPANLNGKLTVYMLAGKELSTFPLFDVEVYLFTLEQSKALQELQQRCKRAMRTSSVDPTAVWDVCGQSQVAAADLIPKLPRSGFTRTDRNGTYRFSAIPAGRRYQVVGMKFEAGDPVLMVGVTPHLKPGEDCTIDISENDSWVDALPSAK